MWSIGTPRGILSKRKILWASLCGAGTQGSGVGEMEGLGTQRILAPGSTAALLCLKLALSLADCWKRIRLYSEWWTRSARRGALDTDPRSSLLLPMARSIDHSETYVKAQWGCSSLSETHTSLVIAGCLLWGKRNRHLSNCIVVLHRREICPSVWMTTGKKNTWCI